ncbi:U6 snRNA phosphodiesterase [Pseudomyrmex gracilis]|uniref:U6 snRNA phosphodiesterase n=1 Tax=Pseudomyrmex gracilis TaxID=219809 RepID=UPI000994EBA6|nr:U6 snRNA phosphodiesterase [Pseudomyrmex gracilis]XP_020299580.1 U6 snRNA phosphodiesterase [Pseudomyrmex gracilis]
MAGLHLIQTYSSDSEDEEDSEKDKTNNDINKLALPASISTWKGVAHHDEIIDDPLSHDGRIRSFKHERGNWATLVYINYIASDSLYTWMKSVINDLPVQGDIIPSFHISLSRTLILKYHWIESFVDSLKLLCRGFNSFVMQLTDVKVYCNEEKTRTFLGIYCHNEDGVLKCLLEAVDSLLAEYQLPPFYKDSSYHISFFWCLGDERTCLRKVLPSVTSSLNKFLAENVEDSYVQIDEVQCKIGNKYYTFQLR